MMQTSVVSDNRDWPVIGIKQEDGSVTHYTAEEWRWKLMNERLDRLEQKLDALLAQNSVTAPDKPL
jgi:hypothetical protein